jgi:hypothetical protein
MARGCFAGVGENLIGLTSSQSSPGARATQAITLWPGPTKLRSGGITSSLRLNNESKAGRTQREI